jgi:hypothetical protein
MTGIGPLAEIEEPSRNKRVLQPAVFVRDWPYPLYEVLVGVGGMELD